MLPSVESMKKIWFLYTGPTDIPGFGLVKTLALIKISHTGPPTYLAFGNEVLAKYRLAKTNASQHFSIVELSEIDQTFYVDRTRRVLVFSSRESIDKNWINSQDFDYDGLLCDVEWLGKSAMK